MTRTPDSTLSAFLADTRRCTQRLIVEAPLLALIPVLVAVATVVAVLVAAEWVSISSGLLIAIILLSGAVAATVTERMSAHYDTWVLSVHPSAKTVLSIGVRTQGQGHETTFAQIVAEELGISPNDIMVRHGDTEKTPYGLGTYERRSTPVSAGAGAVAVVSRRVRNKARLIAARMLETNPDDLVWEQGRWYVMGDRDKSVGIEEIAAFAQGDNTLPADLKGVLASTVRRPS